MAKRILFLRPSLSYGGADRVTVNLINNLDPTKYVASLAVMHTKGEIQNELKEGVKVHKLGAKSLWFCAKPIAKLIKANQFDIVYSTCGGMSIPMMQAVRKTKYQGISVISERNTLYRTYSSGFKKRALLHFKKRLFKHATFATAVSAAVGEELNNVLGVPKEKVRVVNNPLIDDAYFKKCDEPVSDLPEGKFNVVAIGRFVEQKDYPTLLKAFQVFHAEHSLAHLSILGKGPLENQTRELAKSLGISEYVSFLGFKTNPYAYMAKCDVFVLPSLHEGMPGVLVQSLAAGAVCISTDCKTGPNELIQHGENGFLTEIGNHQQIATFLHQIASNQIDIKTVKSNAAKSVDRFRMEEGVQSYLKFLPSEG